MHAMNHMNIDITQKIRPELLTRGRIDKNDIFVFLDEDCVTGDNKKHMKMYNWMSFGMNFMEEYVGRLIYGNSIAKTREEILGKLEWRNGASVLCVSIGTGLDLPYIPTHITQHTLDLVGVDISIGMLKQTKRRYKDKLRLSLVNSCAEQMPFKDNIFDMVFHVGGINFFNNKPRAIREMIRVAKPGSKILLADETSDLLRKQSKWSFFIRKYYKDKRINIGEITNSVPEDMETLRVDYLWSDRFYCVTFRKPACDR